MSKSILVIPDIHTRFESVEKTIAQARLDNPEGIDEIVFLGDYFDAKYAEASTNEATAKWLKKSLEYEDRIHLIGNHDMPYRFHPTDIWPYYCPGFSEDNYKTINNVLTREDWDKLLGAYAPTEVVKLNLLFSHAGFSKFFVSSADIVGLNRFELAEKANTELLKGNSGVYSRFYLPGARMGEARIGGITWADWEDEFYPLENIDQIVGHSVDETIRKVNGLNSVNYCIDIWVHQPKTFFVITREGEIKTTTKHL